ncbi:hypothetical protein B0T19DRAFT_456126, partial [Cercophora scortea]
VCSGKPATTAPSTLSPLPTAIPSISTCNQPSQIAFNNMDNMDISQDRHAGVPDWLASMGPLGVSSDSTSSNHNSLSGGPELPWWDLGFSDLLSTPSAGSETATAATVTTNPCSLSTASTAFYPVLSEIDYTDFTDYSELSMEVDSGPEDLALSPRVEPEDLALSPRAEPEDLALTPRPDSTDSNPWHHDETTTPSYPTYTVTQWPLLKLYLTAPAHTRFRAKPRPTCFCCRRALAIPGVAPHDQPLPCLRADEEYAAILPCGDMLGLDCYTALALQYCLRRQPMRCPACNLSMAHTTCKCPVAPFIVKLNTGSSGIMAAVPRTIPEGGSVPDSCKACRARVARRHLSAAARVLAGGSEEEEDSIMDCDDDLGQEAVEPVAMASGVWQWREGAVKGLHEGFEGALVAQEALEAVCPTWGGGC